MMSRSGDFPDPHAIREVIRRNQAEDERLRKIEALLPELAGALSKANAWIEVFGRGHAPHTTAGSERAKILRTLRPLYERAVELLP